MTHRERLIDWLTRHIADEMEVEAAAMLRADAETIERQRAALYEILNYCTDIADVDAAACKGLGIPYGAPR